MPNRGHAYSSPRFPHIVAPAALYKIEEPLPAYTPPPSQITSHQEWMKETRIGVGVQWRSIPLKAVDNALLKYELDKTTANMWALVHAFDAWKRSKDDWYQSRRNDTHWAPRLLDLRLREWAEHQPSVQFSREELKALRFVMHERKKVLRRQFEGKQFVFRTNCTTLKQAAIDEFNSFKETLLWLPTTIQQIHNAAHPTDENFNKRFTKEDFLRYWHSTITSFFTLNGVIDHGRDVNDGAKAGFFLAKEMAASIVPFVTQGRHGFGLFMKMLGLFRQIRVQCTIGECKYAIEDGTPTLALEALVHCLKKDLQVQAGMMVFSVGTFGVSLVGLSPAAAPITGPLATALNATAKTLVYLCQLGAETRATRAMNKILIEGPLDYRVFKTYPLMGCYILACGNTSDLIPLDAFGKPGWMEHFNSMKEGAFDQLYFHADRLIRESKFEIVGMAKRPIGNAGANLFEFRKAGLAALSPIRQVTKAAGHANFPDNTADE